MTKRKQMDDDKQILPTKLSIKDFNLLLILTELDISLD